MNCGGIAIAVGIVMKLAVRFVEQQALFSSRCRLAESKVFLFNPKLQVGENLALQDNFVLARREVVNRVERSCFQHVENKDIAPGSAVQMIAARTAAQVVVATIAMQHIVTRLAIYSVVALAAVQHVIAIAAIHRIIAACGKEQIIAVTGKKEIITLAADYHIICITAGTPLLLQLPQQGIA